MFFWSLLVSYLLQTFRQLSHFCFLSWPEFESEYNRGYSYSIKCKEVAAYSAISPQNSAANNSVQVLAVQNSPDLQQPRRQERGISIEFSTGWCLDKSARSWTIWTTGTSLVKGCLLPLNQQGKARRRKICASWLQRTPAFFLSIKKRSHRKDRSIQG